VNLRKRIISLIAVEGNFYMIIFKHCNAAVVYLLFFIIVIFV